MVDKVKEVCGIVFSVLAATGLIIGVGVASLVVIYILAMIGKLFMAIVGGMCLCPC